MCEKSGNSSLGGLLEVTALSAMNTPRYMKATPCPTARPTPPRMVDMPKAKAAIESAAARRIPKTPGS